MSFTRHFASVVAVAVLSSAQADTITRQETVTAGLEEDSPLIMPAIPGGTNQTYVLLIATRDNDDVTSVTGGGLTWTELVEQCSGREQQGIRLWTTQGSPGSSFEVNISWIATDSDHPIVAVLTRYSGVGSLEDPIGENTNGESGECDDGDDTDTPQLTLDSTIAGSVHLIGVDSRKDPVISYSPGYAQITSIVEGSGGDKTRLTTFERAFDPAATDTFQATIDHDRDWCTAGVVLNPGSGAGATVDAEVTATGLRLGNAEFLWVRSDAPDDTVVVTIGDLLDDQQGLEQWLYFCRSECFEWSQDTYGCLDSKLQVELLSSVEYDIVAWSEAEDRREPDRDLLIVGQGWTFHPGEINLDGLVNCADIDSFVDNMYDWNLDGDVNEADLYDLAAVVGASLIDGADVAMLLQQWGSCPNPPEPCPGDLDCDGIVGINDFLLLLSG